MLKFEVCKRLDSGLEMVCRLKHPFQKVGPRILIELLEHGITHISYVKNGLQLYAASGAFVLECDIPISDYIAKQRND